MTKRSTSILAHRMPRVRPLILALCGAGCLPETQVLAAPELPVLANEATAPVVGAGSQTTNAAGTARTYTQTTDLAVWHFSSFNIGAGGSVHNQAPKASDLTIFRVMGANQSVLSGPLTANNRLILVNRNGIHAKEGAGFSGGGSLVMSAQDLHPDLTANDYAKLKANKAYIRFVGDSYIRTNGYGGYSTFDNTYGSPFGGYGAGVVEIDPGVPMVAGDGGSIFLVGDRVINRGTLAAPGAGGIGLVASGDVELEMPVGDSGFITLKSHDKLDTERNGTGGNTGIVRIAVNEGDIEAEGGQVVLAQASHGGTSDYTGKTSTPTVVSERLDAGWPPGGVYNTGTINAKGTGAGQGKVTLEAKGHDNVAVNTGTIDASAANSESQAGSIRMSAAKVLHDGEFSDGESRATAILRADGLRGGGTITMDTAMAPADSASGSLLVHVGSFGRISATAANGKGGIAQLGTAVPEEAGASWRASDNVSLQGTLDVRGGAGQGGTLTLAGRNVDVGPGGMRGDDERIQIGAGGLWRVVSPGLRIGGLFQGGAFNHVDPADIDALMNRGVNVAMQAVHEGNAGGADLSIAEGVSLVRADGAGALALTLEATGDVRVGQGVTIASTAGPLDVTLKSDKDMRFSAADGRGSVIIGAPGEVEQPSQLDRAVPLSAVGSRAQSQAFAPQAVDSGTVRITTNGGRLVLDGASQPKANEGNANVAGNAGVAIANAQLDAGQGNVTIQGHGGSTPTEGTSQNGVVLDGVAITGNQVHIQGNSTSATAVGLNDTTVTGTGVTVVGVAQGGDATGRHIGVDIQDNVVFHVGTGGAKVHGLAMGGVDPAIGLRIKSLKIQTTADMAGKALVTLVGQATQSVGGHGLELASGGDGLSLGTGDPLLKSSADVIVGANGGADGQALVMGDKAPVWNTTGRVNIRPMSMEINNPLQATSLNAQKIHIGVSAVNTGTSFNVDPRWLGAGAGSQVPFVVGSSTHTGLIEVADDALNNTGAVSLQNQGGGSAGITLGRQTGVGKLNLLTAGDVSQSAPLQVAILNIKMTGNPTVGLSAAGNRIGALNFDGGQGSPSVAGAARTNSGDASITGFDGAQSTFQALSINAVTSPERPTLDGGDVDRTFEGTDLMSELRTDVYVHGQLSRPQLCTPANTGAVMSVADGGADPLALEWVKVRRGPQLTNCAGMKADSSCSAF